MVVPTYPEGGSHALQVCQHHHQVVRVGHFVGLAETQGTWCSRLLRPIRLKPSRYDSAQCALLYREGGGRWPVRPRVRGVLRRRIARWGQIGPNPVATRSTVHYRIINTQNNTTSGSKITHHYGLQYGNLYVRARPRTYACTLQASWCEHSLYSRRPATPSGNPGITLTLNPPV